MYTDESVCEALTKAEGKLSLAARILQKSSAWMTARCKGNEVIQAHIKQVAEDLVDSYEVALGDLRDKRNATSVIFFLKTKGRHRGYVEHAPIEEMDTGKLKVLSDFFSAIGKASSARRIPTQDGAKDPGSYKAKAG